LTLVDAFHSRHGSDARQHEAVPRTSCADDCCPPLSAARLTRAQARVLAVRLRAVAHPARLRLLSMILAQPAREACVCHLVAPLGLAQPTVTHHLNVLRAAGIVRREQRGVWAWYSVVPGALEGLRAALR
jgi:ArsR family transcriptional regulator